MPPDTRARMTPQLAVGLFIMGLGILLTLDRLNIIDAGRTVRLWPAAIVALGIAMWTRGRDAQGRFWGGVWIFLGSWLLLNTLDLVRVGFWDLFWPVVLVLIGLKLVLHTARQSGRAAANVSGDFSLFAMLGESKRSSEEAPFRSGQMTAIMGGCHLDLRRAVLAPGEQATLDVFALMGGLEVWVPGGWTVNSDVVPILGGVDDKRLLPVAAPSGVAEPQAPPQLLLRGQVVLGGLTIKS